MRTTCRSKPQRTAPALPMRWGAGRADPAQPVRQCPRGAKHRAAGIARRVFPRRQAKRAAPQARRREGLKPNGRDSARSMGRSPKARRRIAPTRPRYPTEQRRRKALRLAGLPLGKPMRGRALRNPHQVSRSQRGCLGFKELENALHAALAQGSVSLDVSRVAGIGRFHN
ncbi:Uncharacterised protein [Klebsiella pneumoniae]|nr:Uncharacterised protein [Klebsiella pneumoniae]STU31047.1 Uncharacterised protein [Klebsiella pneumoniae]